MSSRVRPRRRAGWNRGAGRVVEPGGRGQGGEPRERRARGSRRRALDGAEALERAGRSSGVSRTVRQASHRDDARRSSVRPVDGDADVVRLGGATSNAVTPKRDVRGDDGVSPGDNLTRRRTPSRAAVNVTSSQLFKRGATTLVRSHPASQVSGNASIRRAHRRASRGLLRRRLLRGLRRALLGQLGAALLRARRPPAGARVIIALARGRGRRARARSTSRPPSTPRRRSRRAPWRADLAPASTAPCPRPAAARSIEASFVRNSSTKRPRRR